MCAYRDFLFCDLIDLCVEIEIESLRVDGEDYEDYEVGMETLKKIKCVWVGILF
jgi:hypothetical protein